MATETNFIAINIGKLNNYMTKFEKELQELRPEDEIQTTSPTKDNQGREWDFITTAGHGYLVVPTTSSYYCLAKTICKYGYQGDQAIYLEEDCEIKDFFDRLDIEAMEKKTDNLEVSDADRAEIGRLVSEGFANGYLDREDGARIIWTLQTRIFDNK